MKEYIFTVHEKTPDAIGLSVGQIRRHCKELIRCKDCAGYDAGCCHWWYDDPDVPEDGYCYLAERKEDENDTN